MYKYLNTTYKKNLEFWAILLLLCLLIIKSASTNAYSDKGEIGTFKSSSDTKPKNSASTYQITLGKI